MFEAVPPSAQTSLGTILRRWLTPLASLKLTVVLFALAIFIVFAGTLAQIDQDIWEVMRNYFRTPVAWIPLQIFFPRSLHVGGGFYFPGGFSIGLAMLVNLLAAHSLRFKIQARGSRLTAGLVTTALGIGMTWLVIASGSSAEGLQTLPIVSWSTLWLWCKVGLVGIWLALAYGLARVDSSRKLDRSLLAAGTISLGLLLGWLFFYADNVELGDSSMRILWQLIKGGLASVVLLAGCALLFRKRAGIVLLHAGIVLIMVNEIVVHSLHDEGVMQLAEGQTVNYVQDIRTPELAVTDRSDAETDDVVVVPEAMLRDSRTIRDDALPFDIDVVQYFLNSNIRKAKDGEANTAKTETGEVVVAEEAQPTAGTDAGGEVDAAAAFVRLTAKNDPSQVLGEYLLGIPRKLDESLGQYSFIKTVDVAGRAYDVALQFKRTYKPYSVQLKDVSANNYMGTATAKNYSSDIHLVDPSRHVDRDIKIWMNNPLRFAGETFYQSSFHRDEATGTEFTGLQVVTNTGWMIPYVACMIVGMGMLAQFSIVLLRFLNRRSTEEAAAIIGNMANAPKRPGKQPSKSLDAASSPASGTLAWCGRLFPWVVVILFGAWLVGKAIPPRPSEETMNLFEFGKLPLVYQGRMKPFDTLARNSLRVVSDRETFVDTEDESRPAVQWLLDTITNPRLSSQYKVVRIHNLEVLDTLGLKRREGYRYSIDEFRDQMQEFERQARLAHETNEANPGDVNIHQKKILELDSRLRLYMLLLSAFDTPRIRPEHVKDDLMEAIRFQTKVLPSMQPPLAVPPTTKEGEWEPYATAWTKAWAQTNVMSEQPNPATLALNKILVAYGQGNAKEFNKAVAEYRQELAANRPADWTPAKTNFETLFNLAAPFYYCSVLYIFAFVLAALAWLGWSKPLNRAAFWLIAMTFVVHTAALVARVYISGRPPVTNLYSVAVFVGWGGVALGLALEAVYRLGVGNVIAGAAGFSTLLIANFLAGGGDTFTVLQAVLDTQFWLATHVVIINLGYATTYVAGLLGLVYVLGGVLTPSLSPRIGRELARMIYGTLCFAIFFSFVGTVLGGLWADDSWGRFWGWDPKENGALIIVLWNVLVLHARWDGMIKERGLAVLAIVGNIAVSWSMFGVNELGVGLHSYGFTEGIALALVVFVVTQLAVVALGCLPKPMWWSTRRQQMA